ncbi:unnamed protein product [Dicrocoelium dendriticum]|nr:unnamed protein product [Dicrocoelium dendriticum]
MQILIASAKSSWVMWTACPIGCVRVELDSRVHMDEVHHSTGAPLLLDYGETHCSQKLKAAREIFVRWDTWRNNGDRYVTYHSNLLPVNTH